MDIWPISAARHPSRLSPAGFAESIFPSPLNRRIATGLPLLLRLRRRLLVRLRLDLHQRGYSQLPGDQRFVGRRVDVFWMCSAHAQYLTPDRNKPTGDV